MPYPQNSTHLCNWIFTEEELRRKRESVNKEICDSIRASLTPAPPEDLDLLSWEDELLLVEYLSRQLLLICTSKELQYCIKNTTLTFFKRFFLSRSVMDYDPRVILFTCLLLGFKCEEQSRQMTLNFLLEGAASSINLSEIFHNEVPVLDALYYELQILDVKTPLQYVCDGYYTANRKNWQRQQPGSSGSEMDQGLNPSQELEKVLRSIHQKAETLSLRLHDTDVHFLFTPAQIAAALFIHCARGKLDSPDQFVWTTFAKDQTRYETAIAKLKDLEARVLMYVREEEHRDETKDQTTAKALVDRMDKIKKQKRKSAKKKHKLKSATPSDSATPIQSTPIGSMSSTPIEPPEENPVPPQVVGPSHVVGPSDVVGKRKRE